MWDQPIGCTVLTAERPQSAAHRFLSANYLGSQVAWGGRLGLSLFVGRRSSRARQVAILLGGSLRARPEFVGILEKAARRAGGLSLIFRAA